MEKQRLDYIDVAKGILVLLMVMHHVSYWIVDYCGVHNSYTDGFHPGRWYLYGPFFMTAFFVITGFCSNFDKDIKSFVSGNSLSLLLPMFIMGHGHISWFLACMFTSKMAYWALFRITKSRWIIGIICLLASIAGCLLRADNDLELWGWQHALVVMPFIYMGNQFKAEIQKTRFFGICTLFYLLISVLMYMLSCSPLYFEFGYSIDLCTYPLFLLLAVSGTGFVLLVSKSLHRSRILSIFGQYSIVVYLLHSYFLPPIALRVAPFIEQATGGFWISSALYLFVFTSTAFFCYVACWMFQYKWLSWIIGRFDFQNQKK